MENITDVNQLLELLKNAAKLNKETQNTERDEKNKLSNAELETDLLHVLLGTKNKNSKYPGLFNSMPINFEYDFRVVKVTKGDEGGIIINVKDKNAELVSPKNVASALCEFSNELYGKYAIYNATMVQCEKVVSRWMSIPREVGEMPKSWGFKSDTGIVFNRLNYDPIDCDTFGENSIDTHAPMFCKMLKRIPNHEDFCQMMGSIFYEKASRKQAIWIWGPSGGGKSQVDHLLRCLVGTNSIQAFTATDFDDSFWKYSLVGKRCLFVHEANPDMLSTPSFKSLTGDSMHRVRNLYRGSMVAKLDCMVFCSSNYPPNISNDESLKTRVISCHMDKIPEDERINEHDLQDAYETEIPYIAAWCMKQYIEKNPSFCAIKHNVEKYLMPSIDLHESQELDVINRNFIEGTENDKVTLKEFNTLLRLEGVYSNSELAKYKMILKSRYKINISKVREGDGRTWVVYRIRKRFPTEF